jgi:hypothetical protein
MIKKTIITTVILLMFYILYIEIYPNAEVQKDGWQRNLQVAQQFIHADAKDIENLMLGTSLSCPLKIDCIPHFYNLAMCGQSVQDSLRLIQIKNVYPKNIYIETNFIMKDENAEFLKNFFSPLPDFLKNKYTMALQTRQPIGGVILKLTAIKEKIASNTKNDNKATNMDESDFLKNILKCYDDDYSTSPDPVKLKSMLSKLMEHIKNLKEHQVNVYFYEMPINANLVDLQLPMTIRAEIRKTFSEDMVHFISLDKSVYKTKDGIHLDDLEIEQYTRFFESELIKNNK